MKYLSEKRMCPKQPQDYSLPSRLSPLSPTLAGGSPGTHFSSQCSMWAAWPADLILPTVLFWGAEEQPSLACSPRTSSEAMHFQV